MDVCIHGYMDGWVNGYLQRLSSHPSEQLRVIGTWGTTKAGQRTMKTSSGFQDRLQKKPSQGQVLQIADVGLGGLPRIQSVLQSDSKIKIVNHYGCLLLITYCVLDVSLHCQRCGALVKCTPKQCGIRRQDSRVISNCNYSLLQGFSVMITAST